MNGSCAALPPDFAIVGAAKCGTTALYAYLAGHAQVSMSSRKEPCFWSPDIARTARVESPEEYNALWAGPPRVGTLRGEASTAYLESRVAITAMLAARPDSRMIAMVRNPIDMCAARHSDLLHRFQEDVGDFETAWRLQEVRRSGQRLPRECSEPHALQYAEVARIGDQLERFVAAVPQEQRLIILFDDLQADPDAVYLRTLAFLGLADDGRRGFGPVNSNRNLRSPRLAALHRSLPRRLGPLYEPARTAVRRLGIRPSALINRLNVQHAPRPPLRGEFQAELIQSFEGQVEKVATLVGRDLSHWMRPSL